MVFLNKIRYFIYFALECILKIYISISGVHQRRLLKQLQRFGAVAVP